MARINLLPWREQLREERKKEFLTILALVVLFAGALVFLADRYVNGQIENQNARNAFIKSELPSLSGVSRKSNSCRRGAPSCWIG